MSNRNIDFGNRPGKRTKDELATCEKDLQIIHAYAMPRCPVDYGVHKGHRSFVDQLEAFLNGATTLDPRNEHQAKRAKHMCKPSQATDIHIAEQHKGQSLAWDWVHLAFVAGFLISCSVYLYETGEIDHVLRWGGDWDNDGIIALDQQLKDLPHLELVKPKK